MVAATFRPMAARTLRPRHSDEIRAKIQASQLVNRLTKHAFGEVEMTPTQVNAAKILLSKSVPDLQSVELTGNADDPVVIAGQLPDAMLDERIAALLPKVLQK
jgi:hypothetical protein